MLIKHNPFSLAIMRFGPHILNNLGRIKKEPNVGTGLVEAPACWAIMKLQMTVIAKYLKLPPVKLQCSIVVEDAIKAEVKYFNKNK